MTDVKVLNQSLFFSRPARVRSGISGVGDRYTVHLYYRPMKGGPRESNPNMTQDHDLPLYHKLRPPYPFRDSNPDHPG